MGTIIVDIIIFLGLLFLLVLIFTPIFYYFDKDKADEMSEEDSS